MLQASLRLWTVTSEKRNGKFFTPLLLSSHFKANGHWIINDSVSSQAGSKYWKALENQSRNYIFLESKRDKEIPDCSSKPHRKTTNLQPVKKTQIKSGKKKKKKQIRGSRNRALKPHSHPDVQNHEARRTQLGEELRAARANVTSQTARLFPSFWTLNPNPKIATENACHHQRTKHRWRRTQCYQVFFSYFHFFLAILWGRAIIHKRTLAKFGYRSERKIQFFWNPGMHCFFFLFFNFVMLA